jgi:hypothetical protein
MPSTSTAPQLGDLERISLGKYPGASPPMAIIAGTAPGQLKSSLEQTMEDAEALGVFKDVSDKAYEIIEGWGTSLSPSPEIYETARSADHAHHLVKTQGEKVKLANQIVELKGKLARPMRVAVVLLSMLVSGGYLEYKTSQADYQNPRSADYIPNFTKGDKDIMYGVSGLFGGGLGIGIGALFGSMLAGDEARRRARRIARRQDTTDSIAP